LADDVAIAEAAADWLHWTLGCIDLLVGLTVGFVSFSFLYTSTSTLNYLSYPVKEFYDSLLEWEQVSTLDSGNRQLSPTVGLLQTNDRFFFFLAEGRDGGRMNQSFFFFLPG
jgi:hypothetical protein